jgi:hypothetical protein
MLLRTGILIRFLVNHNTPSPHFILELRILKELGEKSMELRIPKDLVAILGEVEVDCKGVSESEQDKFAEVQIVKDVVASGLSAPLRVNE